VELSSSLINLLRDAAGWNTLVKIDLGNPCMTLARLTLFSRMCT
jgi:hypothetical protein